MKQSLAHWVIIMHAMYQLDYVWMKPSQSQYMNVCAHVCGIKLYFYITGSVVTGHIELCICRNIHSQNRQKGQ